MHSDEVRALKSSGCRPYLLLVLKTRSSESANVRMVKSSLSASGTGGQPRGWEGAKRRGQHTRASGTGRKPRSWEGNREEQAKCAASQRGIGISCSTANRAGFCSAHHQVLGVQAHSDRHNLDLKNLPDESQGSAQADGGARERHQHQGMEKSLRITECIISQVVFIIALTSLPYPACACAMSCGASPTCEEG